MKWIKALERFHELENSAMHVEALLKLATKSSSKGIGAQLHAQHDMMLSKLITEKCE